MEYFPPEDERRYDFLARITEAEDIVGRSERRIDPAALERLTGVIHALREILPSSEASSQDFARWDGMLARCLEQHADAGSLRDTDAAEELYLCLGRIEQETDTPA